MKRLTLLILLISLCCSAFARERVLQSYIFHDVTVLDRNNNLIENIPSSNGDPIGMFILAEIDGTKYIAVTMAEETLYEIQVALTKESYEDGVRAEIYGGGMQYQGQTVPLQVFVFFTKSSIPDDIIVDVFNSPTLIKLGGLVQTKH